MLKNSFSKMAAVVALSSVAAIAQAATVNVEGSVAAASGALAALAGPGTNFDGGFNVDGSDVLSGQVILAGFCFTSDASGQPAGSASCPVTKSVVPVLATGVTSYDGVPNPAGSTFQQAGSTFDGASGTMALTAFSPSFNVNILLDLVFDAIDPATGIGTGSMSASAGILGGASGDFTWQAVNPVPVPAAAWMFGSALLGLASVGRKRKLAA